MKSSVLMAIAGMAWGIYSILGKNAESAISATTASFLISTPICLIFNLTTNQFLDEIDNNLKKKLN